MSRSINYDFLPEEKLTQLLIPTWIQLVKLFFLTQMSSKCLEINYSLFLWPTRLLEALCSAELLLLLLLIVVSLHFTLCPFFLCHRLYVSFLASYVKLGHTDCLIPGLRNWIWWTMPRWEVISPRLYCDGCFPYVYVVCHYPLGKRGISWNQ